jgi:uncharacterized membrane protein YphA (DoxX/SURF4 family)
VEIAAYAAGLLLAVALAVAGVAKLRDRSQTEVAFTQLGLPWAGPLSVLVPVAELLTALALLLVPVAGGVLALVVLGSFTAFLADRVHRGVVAPCRCFGAASDAPVSWDDIMRNGAFLAVALVVVLFAPTVAPFLG